ncbi:hypothetical protein [Aliiglaciecola sp. LCG003]|uniref:hypothetical protein n=1 Tax=Aliiglaciecola sp. LCG003 TaxID=3053655 RepID=UPI002573E6E5|nr:hypothetical protein [Aliiglaciecola sp. LCG003]WJG11119.1 hypothetical protein QR722_08855 [Aliiglaciecola sp. LCG003]
MKKIILISMLAFDVSPAMAQNDPIKALDLDVDGRISIEEAASDPTLSAVFAELDVNKDGYLTAQELSN